MNRGEVNQESITVMVKVVHLKLKPHDYVISPFPFLNRSNLKKTISVAQVEGVAKEKVMVYEAETDFSIDRLNGIDNTVWFRTLNSQPK